MKRLFGAVLVISLALVMPGAALSYDQAIYKVRPITLTAGDAYTFEASHRSWLSQPFNFEWYLDGWLVESDVDQYIFTAGDVSDQQFHLIKVFESFLGFRRLRGRWIIKVLPAKAVEKAPGETALYYQDADGDGYGDPQTRSSNLGLGYVSNGGDCNDHDAETHPGATETPCDAVDQDCDGSDRCDTPEQTYFEDADGDGYGNPAVSVSGAQSGYVLNDTDCNDADAAIHPGAAETCNGADDDCNGATDENVQTPFYYDADGDGFGTAGDAALACTAPPGYVDNAADCNDNDNAVHPGADEVCNSIDDNCDNLIDDDENGVACSAIPSAPQNVAATDISSGLTSITVTWSATDYADYYKVYRAAWEENGNYELVGDQITDTSFTFTQDWQTDVYDNISSFPTGTDIQAELEIYHDQAQPYIFDFKAPAFFKVQACNDLGCSPMSAADAGQAEFIHTAQYSEVALSIFPLWYYSLVNAMASIPASSMNAFGWCGLDVCGPGGGMIMARLHVKSLFEMQVDVFYENYIDRWHEQPAAQFRANGYVGGLQTPTLTNASVAVSGDFDVNMGAIDARLFTYVGFSPAEGGGSDGYITVTYKGASYQFTLAIGSDTLASGMSIPEPLVPARNDADYIVIREDTGYPAPFFKAPATSCALWSDDLIKECDRIPDPQPVP